MTDQFARSSVKRDAVLNYLKTHKNHPDANLIYEELKKDYPDISLGTVYRNLATLADKGYIQELKINPTMSNFDGDTSTHSHFICNKCGKIYDVFDDEKKLPTSLKSFEIDRISTVYYGVCENCLNK